MHTRQSLWTVAAMFFAMAHTSAWAGTIVGTFDGQTFQGKIGMPIIGINDAIPGPGRACWDSPLGGQECGQRIASWKPGAVAWSFVAPSAEAADGIEVILGLQEQSAGNEATIALYDDRGDLPGTLLRSVAVEVRHHCHEAEPLTRGNFDAPYPLERGVQYWVSVSMQGETGGHWHFNGPTSSGHDCAGGRVGSGARLLGGMWQASEGGMLPNCSAAFRVTSPEPPDSQPTHHATFLTTP